MSVLTMLPRFILLQQVLALPLEDESVFVGRSIQLERWNGLGRSSQARFWIACAERREILQRPDAGANQIDAKSSKKLYGLRTVRALLTVLRLIWKMQDRRLGASACTYAGKKEIVIFSLAVLGVLLNIEASPIYHQAGVCRGI